MKKKSLFKRLSSAAMALLLSLSALTQGITASAFSDTNKASQMTPTSQAIGQAQCRISQHQTAAMLIVSTLTSSIQAEQHLSRKNLRTM